MAKIATKADLIVPNLTEASFLLDQEYVANDYDEEYIKSTLKKLCDLGAKKAVLTGVSFNDDKLGVYSYDSTNNEYFSYFREHFPKSFHGTGDVFASTLCGALTSNKTLEESLKIAVDFTVESIVSTLKNPNTNWYGVEFEKALPLLIESIKEQT